MDKTIFLIAIIAAVITTGSIAGISIVTNEPAKIMGTSDNTAWNGQRPGLPIQADAQADRPTIFFPTDVETKQYFKNLGEMFDLIEFGPAQDFEEAIVGQNIFITWKDADSIKLAASHDGGLSWTTPIALNQEGPVGAPVIGAVGKNVMVAWEQGNQVMASTSKDTGAGFMTYQLSQDVFKATKPATYAADGELYTLWFQQQSQDSTVELVGHRKW